MHVLSFPHTGSAAAPRNAGLDVASRNIIQHGHGAFGLAAIGLTRALIMAFRSI